MLKVSPAAHALFQVLSALELHVPARGERSRAQNVRGAYRKKGFILSFHIHTLGGVFAASCAPFLLAASPPLQKVPSETCGGNVRGGEGGREGEKEKIKMGSGWDAAVPVLSILSLSLFCGAF